MSLDALKEDTQYKKLSKGYKDGCTKTFRKGFALTGLIRKKKVSANKKPKFTKNNEKTLFKCDEQDCSAKFKEPEQLRMHKLSRHQGQRPHKCEYEGCEKSYTNSSHLKRHIITSHCPATDTSEEVTCEAPGCGKTYCNKYVLKQHVATVHTDEPNYFKKPSDTEKRHECDEPGCNAAFNRPYRLKNHKLATHAGQTVFKCDYEGCVKSYTTESHLARHKKLSHERVDINATKEVMCGVDGCGRIFSNQYNLKKHNSTSHMDLSFVCQSCDIIFKIKSQLHAHKFEVHGENRPEQCSHCNLDFVHYHLCHYLSTSN